MLVLKYVQNKDVFMRYHKTHLTRRLILETSADSEKEENMVEWLRDVGMPAEYVNKLARMFQDIKVSEDLNQEFKDTNRGAHVAGERGEEKGREGGGREGGDWWMPTEELRELSSVMLGHCSRGLSLWRYLTLIDILGTILELGSTVSN